MSDESGPRDCAGISAGWIAGYRRDGDRGTVRGADQPRQRGIALCVAAVMMLLAACSAGTSGTPRGASSPPSFSVAPPGSDVIPAGIHQIKHVIVVMQENRSFDSYFGTFPGADGIPIRNGKPSVCVTDPSAHTCVAPYPDHADVNGGGPHNYANATADVDGGKMDGFISQAQAGRKGCLDPTNPACTNSTSPT